MPRRCGSKCSAFSGSALSYSTGLRATTTVEVVSCIALPAFAAAAAFFLVWFLVISIGAIAAPLFVLRSTSPPVALQMANLTGVFLPVCYGGEAAEVIRYMECEGGPERAFEFSAGTEHWLARVEEEKRLIEALAFVIGTVDFMYGTTANQNRVKATVNCCWEAGSTFKRVPMACDEKDRPTHLEALVALRLKLIKDHGGTDHKHGLHSGAAGKEAVVRRCQSLAYREWGRLTLKHRLSPTPRRTNHYKTLI
jgi:hypothetical protein